MRKGLKKGVLITTDWFISTGSLEPVKISRLGLSGVYLIDCEVINLY
jgi:hypothetical protein